jgi:hypothetical protein
VLLARRAVIVEDADVIDAVLAFTTVADPPHDAIPPLLGFQSAAIAQPHHESGAKDAAFAAVVALPFLYGRAAQVAIHLHLPEFEDAEKGRDPQSKDKHPGQHPFCDIGSALRRRSEFERIVENRAQLGRRLRRAILMQPGVAEGGHQALENGSLAYRVIEADVGFARTPVLSFVVLAPGQILQLFAEDARTTPMAWLIESVSRWQPLRSRS